MPRLLSIAALIALAPAVSAADFYGEFHVGTTRVGHEQVAFERVEGAYGIGVGVRYNPWFSTQLDWHTLGENRDVPPPACTPTPCVVVVPTLAEHAWVLRAIPRLPLGESFALELGLGVAAWEGDVTVAGSRFSSDGNDPHWSFGFEWRVSERVALTVERQTLVLDRIDFDWTGAAFRYRF